ncbi:DUF1450 domain-containing protein [Alicyclobacillus cycloheptanicus]|uniref:Uncharacterized protein YuzB (UPF0349 family) n=1 Tax=Alicyclobacillus cycloheptanicus TaxID=1457 RepID=A0ABT9XI62_9BACL|nr:DUF1450 domain-containing protein [Alicyclobacillus cycloheptanicus]MDQ0189800.1 uncharacterized protein YuzB (UPF0349 family) [Alicyclobacillus cycloheptanicus]WDM02509.1 DUF1450 domain-containing protein [Alicyclobacillus cycloheptanicus]
MDTPALGIVIVEVCTGNAFAALDLEELEAEFPEVAVLQDECLNHCGLCRVRPFALVNGQRIFAKDGTECLRLVKERVVHELSLYR